MKFCMGLFIVMVSCLAMAKNKDKAVPEFSLEWNSEQPHKHWLFTKGARYDGPARLAPLALVKKLELEEKYEGCTEQVLKIWATYPEFRGWLALQGTQCLVYQLKFAPPGASSLHRSWWNHLMKHGDGILFGPWSSEIMKSWGEYSQLVLKTPKLAVSFRSEVADSWRRYMSNLNKSERQDLYKILVDDLKLEGQESLAERISEREWPSKDKSATGKSADGGTAATSQEELLFQAIIDLLTSGQLVAATENTVTFFSKFPNGKKATALLERLQQSYFTLVDSGVTSEQKLQIEKCLKEAKHLHSSRLIDWAKAAHRRGDFKGALFLAEHALDEEEGSVEGAPLLFIAGRSAYFLGNYSLAVEKFDRLIQRHSGFADLWEVKFRRGFAFMRMQDYSKAEEALGAIWSDPENKSYGLSSLYWLIRLKQKRQVPVDDLMKAMQDRFSLTYYGLKLAAESNQQTVVLESEAKPVVIKQNWVLTPGEKKQWERVQDLARAGWYLAAQGELNNLILNGTPEQKFLWSQQLVQVFAYPQALRAYSELIDLDPRWRKTNYLRTIFPKPLVEVVEAEAQKNELHPLLLFSLIRQESAFHLAATSRSQAKGLMQLIPPTSQEVAQDLRIKNFNSDQMYHPEVNIRFGAHYLAKVIRQFGGNVSVGLAAYNAGPQRLRKFFEGRAVVENPALLSQEDPWTDLWIEELPWLETNLYVKSILRNRVVYQTLERGSFEWPAPVWKDLFLGKQKVSKTIRDSGATKNMKR
ncbi:MAG: putative soluble lytic transglycosylase [Pseudomonadota bacterium]|jgi:soluble lytic murein transglycosylase